MHWKIIEEIHQNVNISSWNGENMGDFNFLKLSYIFRNFYKNFELQKTKIN